MKYNYEIFLNQKNISLDSWLSFIKNIASYLGNFKRFKIKVTITNNKIRYFIISKLKLPLTFNNPDFLIKPIDELTKDKFKNISLYFNKYNHNLIDIINKFLQKDKKVSILEIDFFILDIEHIFKKAYVYYENKGVLNRKRLFWSFYPQLLSIDFNSSKNYFYQKIPKYFSIEKILHLLNDNTYDNLFKVDTFPFLDDNYYLKHTSYDYMKHSLVIGGSGSGKSKFLAMLINNIYKYNKETTKIILIDPHDALKEELGAIDSRRVIDFQADNSSINLFKNNVLDINASIELMLSLFKGLINDQYNSRLERVLRFSSYLLIYKGEFSFINLKKLLVDLEYRNSLIGELKKDLPPSVSYFFLTDFNELKRENYNEAIAPIISFIDEMQMVPIFNTNANLENLEDLVRDNFLTLFSLNRLSLGDKVTKTIAGFLMQQIFILAESKKCHKNLMVIIDEVAVLENPILSRFLSELRKFNTSLILSGQYFSQISSELKESIFANVSNYYLFRVSKSDAISLEENLEIKLANSEKKEDNYKSLTGLKDRECLVRISKNGILYPVFKARTCDFLGTPIKEENLDNIEDNILTKKLSFNFNIDSDIKVDELMRKNSAGRKRDNDEK